MKKLKSILTIIGTAAIGSAFWEWVIKPALLAIYDYVILNLFHIFSDSFYQEVASSIDGPASKTYIYLMMAFAVLILIPPNFFHYLLHKEPKNRIESIFQSVMKFTAFWIIMLNMLTASVANKTARNIVTDIEIIAPYISDVEYKTLKSDFYRMDSKDDYANLVNHIGSIMNENDLNE